MAERDDFAQKVLLSSWTALAGVVTCTVDLALLHGLPGLCVSHCVQRRNCRQATVCPFANPHLGNEFLDDAQHTGVKAVGQSVLVSSVQVLHPAIEKLFDDEVWAHWDNDLKLTCWLDEELQAFAEKADSWQKQRAVLSQEKQDRLGAKTQDAGA